MLSKAGCAHAYPRSGVFIFRLPWLCFPFSPHFWFVSQSTVSADSPPHCLVAQISSKLTVCSCIRSAWCGPILPTSTLSLRGVEKPTRGSQRELRSQIQIHSFTGPCATGLWDEEECIHPSCLRKEKEKERSREQALEAAAQGLSGEPLTTLPQPHSCLELGSQHCTVENLHHRVRTRSLFWFLLKMFPASSCQEDSPQRGVCLLYAEN